jgi:RNA ligase (TIGR02306 family)
MERKLASVQRILDIQPIEGADLIVRAQINGWWVVTAIENGFKVGDLVVYLEIDSWVPHELAPFLSKGKEPRVYEGVSGERLRTVRLRGQVSQGLIMPVPEDTIKGLGSQLAEGVDLTEHLGILKWERPMNAQLAGLCRGQFPHFIRKTDQERCQNITREIAESFEAGDLYEVTRKMDGSSMTVYAIANFESPGYDETAAAEFTHTEVGVCSRNLDLKLDQTGNAFVNLARESGLLDALVRLGKDIAVQGELCGPGIQDNDNKLAKTHLYVYDIFNITTQKYFTPVERMVMLNKLYQHGVSSRFVSHVPVIRCNVPLPSSTIDLLLQLAEGKNEAGNEIEGNVYKRMDGEFSFKAISNKFLLGGKD